MQNKKLRIFLGPNWYGKILPNLAIALREKGIKAIYAIDGQPSPFYDNIKYDVLMDFRGLKPWQYGLKKLKYFWQFLRQHDAFIFFFGQTLLPYNLDLPILKLLGKKVIMWFGGGDIMQYESYVAAAKKVGFKYCESDHKRGEGSEARKKKLRMIRRVERYVDYIFSYPSISQLLSRKYYLIHLPMDIENIRYNNTPNPRPIVVHAPLDPLYKGTSYILEAVERLKGEGYNFEFHLFTGNVPTSKLREILTRADIVVDQLFSSVGGTLAVESMAAGCAVLSGNFPKFSHYPPESPIIDTHPDNIYQNLKLLLENPELRQELREKGRKYVEKYNDAKKIADDILQLLSGDTKNLVSYDPTNQL